MLEKQFLKVMKYGQLLDLEAFEYIEKRLKQGALQKEIGNELTAHGYRTLHGSPINQKKVSNFFIRVKNKVKS